MVAQTKAELEAENAELKAQLAYQQEQGPEPIEGERNIYQRLLAIANEVGIVEKQRNPDGGIKFAYRGVDQVTAALTPLLNKHQVLVLPVQTLHDLEQRTMADGRVWTKAKTEVTYRFVGPDGDYVDVETPGQADDLADRSTAQAMSVAFRTALLQSFHIAASGEDPEESGERVTQARATAATSPNAKIATAQAKASPAENKAVDQMRLAIQAAGKARPEPLVGADLSNFATKVTGKELDEWWDDPNELNKVLTAISGG